MRHGHNQRPLPAGATRASSRPQKLAAGGTYHEVGPQFFLSTESTHSAPSRLALPARRTKGSPRAHRQAASFACQASPHWAQVGTNRGSRLHGALLGGSSLRRKYDACRHFSSGASRDRTGDLLLAKQALSQLSYGPRSLNIRPDAGSSPSSNGDTPVSPAPARSGAIAPGALGLVQRLVGQIEQLSRRGLCNRGRHNACGA